MAFNTKKYNPSELLTPDEVQFLQDLTVEYGFDAQELIDTIDTKLPLEGGTMTGNLDMDDNEIQNARVVPRVTSTASSSSLTPTKATTDRYIFTALAANLTINNPTAEIGETFAIQITDNGTSRTLTFDTQYVGIDGNELPTETTISKTMEIICTKLTASKILVSNVIEE